MSYVSALDVESLTAIDMHVHVEVDDHGHNALPQELVDAASKYFKTNGPRPGLDDIAEIYRERKMAAVVFTVDARRALGHKPNSSEEIAIGAARNNDVLIPFGSVDPTTNTEALERARLLAGDFGVRGFKFHPTVQNFDPSDQQFYPLWELLQSFGLPAIFHTGQTGIGSGLPGGFGLKLALSNPILLDSVAADFPELQIIMAHPSVPWQEEAIAVATHKANVWIDLSGWSPKYFPEILVRQANSVLQNKVLFGSDFPLISPDRWMSDFADLTIKDEVRPKIIKDNAVRLLGLNPQVAS
ncbi:putative TIM-barrel fold metal-dependent hydrolase [Arthrobacter sp. V4I6]|uniref:amidohydrolase family protein n=1 Tax=unclassified Arthrobacter TaxID=235627 RepID=UPI002785A6D3|nr:MULTISPECIES: amidohydrolase family protein [unclassified Arthrobacter]MDQ0821430.1 putative TIM-barrel fold metal-dependent hydrolase [Arthrobacter sp. V1I7]MDQ0855696.1 putative TIM-barrel fold metal-dependent hydrolase [Arthrobacter sp. V4I6]